MLEILVPVLLAAAVFTAAMGSSSVTSILRLGLSLRWVALALLALAALPYGLPELRRVPRSFAVALGSLAALALLSTIWSVRPRSTFERGGTFVVLSAIVILIAAGAASSRRRVELIGMGLLAAPVAVALAGIVVYFADYHLAIQAAGIGMPERLRGFGQDPNTGALLFSVALPIAVAGMLGPVSRRRRAFATGVAILLYGSTLASGSRGGIVASIAGVAVLVAVRVRPRRLLFVAEALVGAAALLSLVTAGARPATGPDPNALAGAPPPITAPATTTTPSTTTPASTGSAGSAAPAPTDVAWWQVALEPTLPRSSIPTPFLMPRDEIGYPGLYAYKRLLSYGSGRVYAWVYAIQEGLHRPALGYGFGTEPIVFQDVFFYYQSAFTENSFVGIFLQLGLVGLVLLLLPFALCLGWAARALRRHRDVDRNGAVALGMTVAALLAGLFQSYLYSVGNVVTLTSWSAVALTAVLVSAGLRSPGAA